MKKCLFIFCLLLSVLSFSQELVLIGFKDKPSSAYYLSHPDLMLSQKALDRRVKYGISLSYTDVPVENTYLTNLKYLGISYIAVSRWFNGVFAEINPEQKTQIETLPYIQKIESFVKTPPNSQSLSVVIPVPESLMANKSTSAVTDTQINQIGLDYLHSAGFTGKNITIAVMDAGFPNVNTIPQFDYIRSRGQIKGGYNFVDNNNQLYTRYFHGTQVLSILGAYDAGQYTGTAIDSDFYLFITEKNEVEIPQEEVWWIAAAEKADSLGVDIINTSLGYNSFDDSRYNYNLSDLDGKTSFISRAAQTAAEKGVFVVVAAGNEGNSSWKKIALPADAEDVFTIGSVNSFGIPASSSSYGPSSDGRIKPDVSALGNGTSLINPSGTVSNGNGTSFATPVISGAVACLMQAYPSIPPSVLRQKIRESASHFNNPENQLGYGIPDFNRVFQSLSSENNPPDPVSLKLYPNPVKDILYIEAYSEKSGIMNVEFFNYNGQKVYSEKSDLHTGKNQFSIVPPHRIKSHSVLFIKIQLPDGKSTTRKITFV